MRKLYRNNKDTIKDGIISVLPIAIGYIPIGMAFGLLSKNAGMNFSITSLFSIAVYAGASQFMALDLILAGVSTGSIILATFLLNLRHMMMSASLAIELKSIDTKFMPIVAFGITDESFSVLSFNKEKLNLVYILIVNTIAYGSWVLGTILGYLVGEILPKTLQSSLSIGLYCMFASLLFPQVKKSKSVLDIMIISILVYSILFYSNLFSAGWDIIIGIIIASFIGTITSKKKGVRNE